MYQFSPQLTDHGGMPISSLPVNVGEPHKDVRLSMSETIYKLVFQITLSLIFYFILLMFGSNLDK